MGSFVGAPQSLAMRIPVQVHFDGERRPIALSRRKSTRGQRVIIEVEEAAIEARSAFVLYRSDVGDMVLAASANRESIEAARQRLGAAASKYEIADVPLI
jgi:hypothetical protein